MIGRFLLWAYQWRIARLIAVSLNSARATKLVRFRRRERQISRWIRRPNLVRLIRMPDGETTRNIDPGDFARSHGHPCFYQDLGGGLIKLEPTTTGPYELFILDRGPHSMNLDPNFPPVQEVRGRVVISPGFVDTTDAVDQ